MRQRRVAERELEAWRNGSGGLAAVAAANEAKATSLLKGGRGQGEGNPMARNPMARNSMAGNPMANGTKGTGRAQESPTRSRAPPSQRKEPAGHCGRRVAATTHQLLFLKDFAAAATREAANAEVRN